jgi:RNA polymerase sigma-70 factor, ECF subfamily
MNAVAVDRANSFAALCADERAFSAWYAVALPRVYGFVYGRAARDSALAEDITAQAFLEAVRARGSFDDRADPITWVCSIARNRLIDHYRSVERERARHLRLIVTNVYADEQAAWENADDRDAVLSVLEKLPPLERTALTLRYLDGFSVVETAQKIGRSTPATESLLMRARERIRAAFPGGLE